MATARSRPRFVRCQSICQRRPAIDTQKSFFKGVPLANCGFRFRWRATAPSFLLRNFFLHKTRSHCDLYNRHMRILMFTGKGGVGKTSLAAATGVQTRRAQLSNVGHEHRPGP